MQRKTMTNRSASIRNKLMLACALVMAGVLATPAALAHDRYRHHDNTGKVLGALVVGAVIGGVIASASQHDDGYYQSGYYQQGYPQQPYYYGSSYPAYPSYPAYYPSRGYGSSVNVGVVYTSGGGHYYRDSHRYRDRGYRHGHRDRGYDRGGRGHYYSRHDH